MDVYQDLTGKSRRELLEIAEQYEWMLQTVRANLIAVHHRLFVLTEEMDVLPESASQAVEIS